MSRLVKRPLLLLAAFGLIALFGTFETRAELAVPCFVTTTSGDVQGVDLGTSCQFLGIPYAAPPTGARRWRAPEPHAGWTTPLPANMPPPSCPNVNSGSPAGMEDCLKMNIWAPDPSPSTPAPVIVWLHTGGFVAASANFASHKGQRLAEETGVIVVAPNYRLGPLGFLVHDALAADDPARPVSGNYGLLDQRAVLRFVRDNIASFGGDPNNVTLAGTSAGADSTGLHLVSPGSARLFHRAVIESGAVTIRWPTHAEAAAQGDAFATALGCVDPATVVACMRTRTPAQVLTALPLGSQTVLETPGRAFWQPVVDGLELPNQPRLLFEAGLFEHVPTIIGTTRDEASGSFVSRSFPAGATAAQYDAWLTTEFGGDAGAVAAQYPVASVPLPVDAMARVVTDGQFVCEGRRLARALSDAHTNVYVYSYAYEIDEVFPDRVIHGVESNILFGNDYVPNQFPNHVLNAADLALHGQMAGYWTRFAATGNPKTDDASVVTWNAFKDPLGKGRGSNLFLILDGAIRVEKRLREEACDFWEPYFLRTMLGRIPAQEQSAVLGPRSSVRR